MTNIILGSIATCIGVILGFILTLLKEWWDRKNNTQYIFHGIDSELKSNLSMIKSKDDILKQAKHYVPKKQILSPGGISFLTSFYTTNISDIVTNFKKDIDRNSLHIIYGHMISFDQTSNTLERDFIEMSKVFGEASSFAFFEGRINSLEKQLHMIKDLIEAHLNHAPINTLGV